MVKKFYVYILSDGVNCTLYVGVTSNLVKRIHEHRNCLVEGLTGKYKMHRLVWYEMHESAESAIMREKQLKRWNWHWKIREIENMNPAWEDLCETLNV